MGEKKRIKRMFVISYEAPYPESEQDSKNWLCQENLEDLLNKHAPGGKPFIVRSMDD